MGDMTDDALAEIDAQRFSRFSAPRTATERERIARSIERRQAEVDRLRDQLDRIEAAGEEPPVDTVLSFVKTFGNADSRYSYAALRIDDPTRAGWRITGHRGAKEYSWEGLLAFIAEREPEFPLIHVASSWDLLA